VHKVSAIRRTCVPAHRASPGAMDARHRGGGKKVRKRKSARHRERAELPLVPNLGFDLFVIHHDRFGRKLHCTSVAAHPRSLVSTRCSTSLRRCNARGRTGEVPPMVLLQSSVNSSRVKRDSRLDLPARAHHHQHHHHQLIGASGVARICAGHVPTAESPTSTTGGTSPHHPPTTPGKKTTRHRGSRVFVFINTIHRHTYD
jgi:hypothetical protein